MTITDIQQQLITDKRLKPASRLVGLFILNMKNEGLTITINTIAQQIRCGTFQTGKAIRELEDYGYIIRGPVRKNGKITKWNYIIQRPTI